MEIEHSNDTSGTIREMNQKTINVEAIQQFSQHQQRAQRQLRQEAFAKF